MERDTTTGESKMQAIQIMSSFKKENDAVQSFDSQKTQDGFLGGRILPPTPSKPKWRVQTFFSSDGCTSDTVLPYDTKLVTIPKFLQKALGF